MKKIYLLSAAALFAFSANAQGKLAKDATWNEWYVDGAQAEAYEVVTVSSTNMTMAKVVTNDKCANEGDVEFCNVFHEAKGQEAGAMFTLDFDVMFEGETSDTATIYTLTGKLLNNQHADWQWTSYSNEDGSVNEDGNTELMYVNEAGEVQNFWSGHNKTWKLPKGELVHVTWGGKIGTKGADWIGVQINLYDKVNYGNFYFANVVAQFGKKKMEWFMNGGDNTAVAETAAIKAYVANDVLYASEAADVVVYNINGVAVKSAKNVTSLNVADLKAGLYIAKFGNATVKFVK